MMASGAGSWWDTWFVPVKRPTPQVTQRGRIAENDPYARVPRGVPLSPSIRGLKHVGHLTVPFNVQSVLSHVSPTTGFVGFTAPVVTGESVSPGGGVGDSGDGGGIGVGDSGDGGVGDGGGGVGDGGGGPAGGGDSGGDT